MTSAKPPLSSINRTFSTIPPEGMADIENWLLRDHVSFLPPIGWDEMLESMRILIVSEAGTGKTFECRNRQRALWEQGEPSFFFELADLARSPIDELLTPDDELRFEEWRTSQTDVASFFLDSIDELRLTRASFKTALLKLGRALRGNLNRARIIITTRPIPLDQHVIQQCLPFEPLVEDGSLLNAEDFAEFASNRTRQPNAGEPEVARPTMLVVTLLPLSDEQIRKVAETQRVEDLSRFLTSVRERNAYDFARRPQDLIELCAEWRSARAIRCHKDQVLNNVHIKLKPRADRIEPVELSPAQAFEGASRLALAAILGRRLTIKHSAESDLGATSSTVALDPARVLPDWGDEKIQVLLERGMFGFANYGRVRFHHRSVLEFLAAKRLEDRLKSGMSLKAVKRLLFATTPYGVPIVKPSMVPVATWLAGAHRRIFDELLDRSPELFFLYGDPESLSVEERIEVLEAFVDKYRNGCSRGIRIPALQASRFATPSLAVTVRAIWSSEVENLEVRELLLQLIGFGKMDGCIDFVFPIATDQCRPDDERLAAIEAIELLGDSRVSTIAQHMEDNPESWSERLIRRVLIQLFPSQIPPEQLVRLLVARIGSSLADSGYLRYLAGVISHETLDTAINQRLLRGLLDAVREGVSVSDEWPHVRTSKSALVPILAASCLRHLKDGYEDEEDIFASVLAIAVGHDHEHDNGEPVGQLRAYIASASGKLRERLFWSSDSFHQSHRPEEEPRDRLVAATYTPDLMIPNYAQDYGWVCAAYAQTSRSLEERQLLLETLLTAMASRPDIDDQKAYLESLKDMSGDEQSLLERLRIASEPVTKSERMIAFEARQLAARKESEIEAEESFREWLEFWQETVDSPEHIQDERRFEKLWGVMGRAGGSDVASGWNRRFLEQYFGKSVTDQIRLNICPLWRRQRPILPVDRPHNESRYYDPDSRLGLAALWAEAEDPTWARKLSKDEAYLAAHYVPLELSGSTAWLEQLAEAFPSVVQQVLSRQLQWELDRDPVAGDFCWVLNVIKGSPPVVKALFEPSLVSWLAALSEPAEDAAGFQPILGRAHAVVDAFLSHAQGDLPLGLPTLVLQKLQSVTSPAFRQLWLSAAFVLDCQSATTELQKLLSQVTPASSGEGVNLFANTFGGRWNSLPFNLDLDLFSLESLVILLRLAYQHVSPADDLRRDGHYRPTERDDAQQARNTLLSAFLDRSGAEAWRAKVALVADPLFSHFKERLYKLALEKAAEEMDEAELAEDEISLMDAIGEASPKNRDEMFALLTDRLDDLDDYLLQDNSPREAWASLTQERVMRREIARRLDEASQELYVVDQEAVTADEKETDIRFRSTSRQQAIIELKLGEKWTGSQLFRTVRDQLVTKYLAHPDCRSGCLLVTVATDRNWEHPDTEELMDIHGLRTMLETEAEAAMDQLGREVRILVKVLDLRPRLTR